MRSIALLCDDKYMSTRNKVSMTRNVYERESNMKNITGKQYMKIVYEQCKTREIPISGIKAKIVILIIKL